MSIADVAVEAPAKPPVTRRARRIVRALALCVGFFILLLLTLCAAAALHFDLANASLRIPAAIAYVLGVICLWIFVKPRRLAFLMTLGSFAFVLALWFRLAPSNYRPWQPDVAILPAATFAGDQVTIRNIRNCLYRSETDFDVRHYDKTSISRSSAPSIFTSSTGAHLPSPTPWPASDSKAMIMSASPSRPAKKKAKASALRGFFRQFEIT